MPRKDNLNPSLLLHPTNHPFKWCVLTIFIIQISILLVTLRASAVHTDPSEFSVISSTEVLFSEILKLIISLTMCYVFDARLDSTIFRTILTNAFCAEDSSDFSNLTVPAILYIIQNNLQYVIETRIFFTILNPK